ncbi:hypothetical protein [Cellulomonas fengjieae]|uniref:Secreted protein n=1 Tax=Cellulomonas fengjieae TaxID=2819978 RepID=A0ABS3SCH4_9CELL|nr:hypothetical protein [Cellulomonas fengjieae]MBO3083446.1 hypothetical protein [Cellulomonas fengjieae]MBO3101803.1 hypothetical protein [Cellulomonas fengjieae]QVI65223.1 hypothetical protein KG102_13985 [Cellulomonas fengjieae]
MNTFIRRSVRTMRVTGGLATLALELAGAAAAVALVVVSVASSPVSTARTAHRPAVATRSPTLMMVPTQRSAPPGT